MKYLVLFFLLIFVSGATCEKKVDAEVSKSREAVETPYIDSEQDPTYLSEVEGESDEEPSPDADEEPTPETDEEPEADEEPEEA